MSPYCNYLLITKPSSYLAILGEPILWTDITCMINKTQLRQHLSSYRDKIALYKQGFHSTK